MFRDSHERIPLEEERSNKTENGRMKKVIQRGSIRSTRYKNLFRDCRWSGIDRCNILSYRFFEKIKDLLFLSGAGLGCKREHGRCFVVVSSRDFKSRLTFLQKSGNTLKTRLSLIEKFHKVFRKIRIPIIIVIILFLQVFRIYLFSVILTFCILSCFKIGVNFFLSCMHRG